MPREQFRDPLSVLATYQFAVNHLGEDANQRTRSIQRTANTAGTGYVRQQGPPSPELLRYTGSILTQAQHDAMQAYFNACSTRTIFFTDFTGVEKEIVITSFNPKRISVLRNTRDPSLKHYWTYDIEMEVIG